MMKQKRTLRRMVYGVVYGAMMVAIVPSLKGRSRNSLHAKMSSSTPRIGRGSVFRMGDRRFRMTSWTG